MLEIPGEVLKFNDLVFPNQKWFECTSMKKLDLSHNQIKSIPPEISQNRDLEIFRLTHNGLTEVDETISSLDMLKFLDLSFNKIGKISHKIRNLENLVELNL